MVTPVIIFGLFVMVFFVMGISTRVVGDLKGKDARNSTKLKPKRDSSSLEHINCDVNVGDSCLHLDGVTDRDYKACKNCGHNNAKNAKKCSVCGKKLPWI
ncbi:MAG: zinc ribbon domain-containing protein [Clostridia bacterium]|nr:zinc ribbon domain-containing protein [Clostridia bacterium]